MKKFIKIDYYIQTFLAFVLNPLGIITVVGIIWAFPIIGLYQLISDVLHLFVYKTEYLKKQRTIHFYGAIVCLIAVGLGTYGISKLRIEKDYPTIVLFIIFYILIPEIMIWVRWNWARKHFQYEKNKPGQVHDIIEELQEK